MKNNIVSHPCTIKSIDNNIIEVSIIVTSGCASCEIKGACSLNETEEKAVFIKTKNANRYHVGQTATIEMRQSLGLFAVLLGFVLPLIILVLGLIIFIHIGINQGLSGLLSLSLLLPYYLALFIFRNKIGSKFDYNLRV